MEKKILEKYADLIAGTGVNVRPGQDVIITAEFDQPEFVRMVVESCYRRGARKVTVDWIDAETNVLHYTYRDEETLGEVEKWEEERMKGFTKILPCRIYIESEDPDVLKGVDQDKVLYSRQKRLSVLKKYRDEMENKYQWCIAAVPGKKWAAKLFPDVPAEDAVEKLWEKILFSSRVTDNPAKAWEEHNRRLRERCSYLNGLGIESLHYKSANGTDFTVGLMEQSVFQGGQETSLSGIGFNPNIPSEECFTSPRRGCAEGVLHSTKPLSYQGELIEDFTIVFKDGRAVEWDAKKGKALLTRMLTFDDGASYLGECALVPFESPINQSGILYYNTLFDENAACHFAIGEGFPDCVKGFENMSLEEVRRLGVNQSLIHVDFMIGNRDLNITAKCRNGKTVPIFSNGTWA